MIAGVTGVIESVDEGLAVVRVGGISLEVHVPSSDDPVLGKPGDEVHLFTYLYLRADLVTLYGFPSSEELQVFRLLLDVHGIGPKTALSVLSALEPSRLLAAIAGEDVNTLSAVPGIGKKGASRMVLELKGKLEKIGLGALVTQAVPEEGDVIAALTGLGFSTNEAARAAAQLPRDKKLSLEDKMRLALGYFAKR